MTTECPLCGQPCEDELDEDLIDEIEYLRDDFDATAVQAEIERQLRDSREEAVEEVKNILSTATDHDTEDS